MSNRYIPTEAIEAAGLFSDEGRFRVFRGVGTARTYRKGFSSVFAEIGEIRAAEARLRLLTDEEIIRISDQEYADTGR